MNILEGKVLIMNAPAGAGKDTITNALCDATGATHRRFKTHLYTCTATVFNMPLQNFVTLAQDTTKKEIPHPNLLIALPNFFKLLDITKSNRGFTVSDDQLVSISPREALIFVSEIVIKPTLGEDYFGRIAAESTNIDTNGSIFSDGGFKEELVPIVNKVGGENVHIIQFTRKGSTNFNGDSRDWLSPLKCVSCYHFMNDSSVEEAVDKVLKYITTEEGKYAIK